MTRKVLLLSMLGLAVLAGCAHPLDRALEARDNAHRQTLVTNGKISSGACDDVGQFIARDRVTGLSLEQEASAAPTR